MKKLIIFIIPAFLFLNSLNAVTYNSEPKIFITELIEDAIKTLSDKSITKEEKSKIIEKIAQKNVDINGLGMYTLGKVRKTLSDAELDNYNKLFEKYFLKSLTSRLTDYSSNKFEVLSSEQKSATYTIVQSKILESSTQPEIKIDWRVYTKDPLKPLIRDLIVEGLSLARTQKEEFASILNSNNNDIKALLSKLEEFTSK
ncbi:ABC transporter substrate-binding protein [Pelagibacteraceae bacterium]|mgnify:CR=1 FL=1|nr:ABC transporter substrate-binding protein [Pelagibacteraceae bacterium]|tara:strand:- start:504 stop:1103 length:600 start_codon:yes stop_codon:yes gene_type:complete